LHCAAANVAPLEVIEQLITAHPAACMEPARDVAGVVGELPLQLAVRHGARTEVIERLERASPGIPRVQLLCPWRRTRSRSRGRCRDRGRGRGPPGGMGGPPPGGMGGPPGGMGGPPRGGMGGRGRGSAAPSPPS
jgi:hypothetical protein